MRLARGIHQDEVHAFLERHDEVWELTVVTLDKPYLFSNISGVLSYFGMDIHRGQAMTTPEGLVLDVFEFSDEGGFLRQNADAPAEMSRLLENVVAGSVDVPTLLRGKLQSLLYRNRRHGTPIVRFDNEHSRKYTVLEIVADDAPGLLYRISRVIFGVRLRRRSGAHLDRGQEGGRRAARHQAGEEAHRVGTGLIARRVGTHAGGQT